VFPRARSYVRERISAHYHDFEIEHGRFEASTGSQVSLITVSEGGGRTI
jgi:hypothetical protein